MLQYHGKEFDLHVSHTRYDSNWFGIESLLDKHLDIFIELATGEPSRHIYIRDEIIDRYKDTNHTLTGLIENGKESGEFDPQHSISYIVNLINVMLEGLRLTSQCLQDKSIVMEQMTMIKKQLKELLIVLDYNGVS